MVEPSTLETLFKEQMSFLPLIIKMKDYGVKVDEHARERHRERLEAECASWGSKYAELVNTQDFPLGAAGQNPKLKVLFFEKFGIQPSSYTDTGDPKLDKEVLLSIKATHHLEEVREITRVVLKFRENAKLLSTYVKGLPVSEEGFVHPTWKPHGTITGRWSCAEPNLMNQPGSMRDMYIPRSPDNVIVGADFSQLELRIVAGLAGAKKLLSAFDDPTRDVHTETARDLFGEKLVPKNLARAPKKLRQATKIIEYGFNYNATDDVTEVYKGIVKELPGLTIAQLKLLRRQWFLTQREIHTWRLEQIRLAEQLHYVEEPLSKRREYFPDGIIDPNQVLNFPIQAMAGTLTNRALLQIHGALDWGKEFLLAQVHDAIYLEGPKERAPHLVDLLKWAMEQEVQLGTHTVPFPIDVSGGFDMKNLMESWD